MAAFHSGERHMPGRPASQRVALAEPYVRLFNIFDQLIAEKRRNIQLAEEDQRPHLRDEREELLSVHHDLIEKRDSALASLTKPAA
jgi:hypothetical protein